MLGKVNGQGISGIVLEGYAPDGVYGTVEENPLQVRGLWFDARSDYDAQDAVLPLMLWEGKE